MSTIPSIPEAHLQAICDVLGETSAGLTGTEIGELLRRCGITDPLSGVTKRYRLFEALRARQRQDCCGNLVIAFIRAAMEPVRYIGNTGAFHERRDRLNHALAFCGLTLREDGQIARVTEARTLSEANERAGRLRAELLRRGIHGDVLSFCRAELLKDSNYFHAVLEATKSVADKIRTKAGLGTDGSELVDQALGLGKAGIPLLAFNTLQTDSERSEHTGLMNLTKGMFGTFRNPTAHAPKVAWTMTEDDALDLLSIASYLHRRLDRAVRTNRPA